MRMMLTTMVAVVAGGAALAQPAYDDYRDRDRPRAEFFVDDDYKGRSIVFDHAMPRLAGSGIEDRISSIGIQAGAWEVCEDDDYRGRCVVIDRSISRLTDLDFDDRISSLRPEPPRDRRFLNN